MSILTLDNEIFEELDSSTKQIFAKDYIFTAGSILDGEVLVSPADILAGLYPELETVYIPALDVENGEITIGEISVEAFTTDYAFQDREALKKIMQETDELIFAMYFNLSPDDMETITFADEIFEDPEDEKVIPDSEHITSFGTAQSATWSAPSVSTSFTAPVLKPIDYDIVKDTALNLIAENGSTTSLEVKEELREDGYQATQDEVSDFLKDVARDENLDFAAEVTDGNSHLVYSL